MVRTIGIEPDPAKRLRTRQGKAIRDTRKLRGMTHADLAEAVGVTEGAVRHWEEGRYAARQHHQVKIASALGVPWGVLFSLDGEAA